MKISKNLLKQIIVEEVNKAAFTVDLILENNNKLLSEGKINLSQYETLLFEQTDNDFHLFLEQNEQKISSSNFRPFISQIAKAFNRAINLSEKGSLLVGNLINKVVTFIEKFIKKGTSAHKVLLSIAGFIAALGVMGAFTNQAEAAVRVGKTTFQAYDQKGEALKGVISTLRDISAKKGDADTAKECDRIIEYINHSKVFRVKDEGEMINKILLRSVASLDIVYQFQNKDEPLWNEVMNSLVDAGKKSTRKIQDDFGKIKVEASDYVEPSGKQTDYTIAGTTKSAEDAGKKFVKGSMYGGAEDILDLTTPRLDKDKDEKPKFASRK